MNKKWIDKIKFWQRRQPTYTFVDNFPSLVKGRRDVQLHGEWIAAIGGWIAGAYAAVSTWVATASTTMYGVTVGGVTYGLTGSQIGYLGLYAGLSAASYLASSTQNQKQPTSLRGGTQVNGHAPGDPVRIPYGRVRTGGTWAYWKTTSSNALKLNDYLHVIVGWGEGECSLDKDIEPGFFSGLGLNDLSTGGYYTGGTHNEYQVRIDGVGSPNTFKWSDDGGSTWEATGVLITGDWQTLNNGVKIKFGATAGHTIGGAANFWSFYAGDGIWVGDRLLEYFIDLPPAINPWIEHHFHGGSLTQTVDTDLQGYVPEYDNPHKGLCYSYFRLRAQAGSDMQVWSGVPEFRATLKKIDILDVRGTPSVGYSNNAALILYDFFTNARYGRGLTTTKLLTADFIAAANWCDPDLVTHGGSTYTCIGDHTSGASTEPGVGGDWQTFWELTGSGGSAWTMTPPTYYRMGFTFNGVILDKKEANEIIQDIQKNFLGFSFESEGKVRLKTWDNDTAVMTFSEMDNEIEIDPSSFAIEGQGIEESPNIVKCNFINPNKNWGWDSQQYPDDNTLTTLPPSGNAVIMEMELIGTTSPRQAKQIAKFHYNRLKYSNRFNILAHPKLYALEPGDMITCTATFPGWTTKKVRVDVYQVVQDGLVPVVIMDENAAIYDLSVTLIDEDAISPGSGEIPSYLPSQVTGLTITDCNTDDNLATGELIVSWTDNDAAEGVIEYRIKYVEKQGTTAPGTIPVGGGGFGYDPFGSVEFGYSSVKEVSSGKQ